MLREYAVDPEIICSDTNTFHRFLSEFGADIGRVIGDVPHQWKKEVIKNLQALGLKPVEKRRWFDKLEKLSKYAVVKRDGQALQRGQGWIEKAIELHDIEKFNAVLTDRMDAQNRIFDYYRMIEAEPQAWEIGQTLSVVRTGSEMASAVESSLLLSNQFIFVDPYFHPGEERYRIPFIEFLKKIKSGRTPPAKVYLHTCEQSHIDPNKAKTRSIIQRDAQSDLMPLLPQGMSLEIWLWPDDQLHDRFILSNLVGYAFGHGLDEVHYQAALKVNINRISEQERKELFRKHSNDVHRKGEAILISPQPV